MAVNRGDIHSFGNRSTALNQDGVAAAAFTTFAGTPTDPTAVTLIVQRPDDTQLVYGWPSAGANGTLTKESAGRFYFDVTLNQSGVWRYKLSGSGTVTAVEEGSLRVIRERVTSP